jgi:hypothetical protein
MMVLTMSTIPTIAQTTTLILTWPIHISTDGRPNSQIDTSQTQHQKGSLAWIRQGERVSEHLISATDLRMDGYDGFFFNGLSKNRGAVGPSMAGG